MTSITQYLRRLLGVDAIQDKADATMDRLVAAEIEVKRLRRIVGANTEAHLDIHPYTRRGGQCTVVLIGHYKGAELVEIVNVEPGSFSDIVAFTRKLRVKPGLIDVPPNLRSLAYMLRREWE